MSHLPSSISKETLGYQIHTNRELGMMLRGVKPLAVFSDVRGRFPLVLLRYLRIFDRHVERGTFTKRVHTIIQADTNREIEIVLYALPKEAWRIDAMIALRSGANWTAVHERREGMLLGYTDAQNEIWIAKRFAR